MDKSVRFFDKVLELTPPLHAIIERLNEYCSRYVDDD
jgi:hypothetical protein